MKTGSSSGSKTKYCVALIRGYSYSWKTVDDSKCLGEVELDENCNLCLLSTLVN